MHYNIWSHHHIIITVKTTNSSLSLPIIIVYSLLVYALHCLFHRAVLLYFSPWRTPCRKCHHHQWNNNNNTANTAVPACLPACPIRTSLPYRKEKGRERQKKGRERQRAEGGIQIRPRRHKLHCMFLVSVFLPYQYVWFLFHLLILTHCIHALHFI